MTSFHAWNGRWRVFVGVVCSLLLGWAALAVGFWLTTLAVGYFDSSPSRFPPLFPPMKLVIGIGLPWIAAFPVIGFAMGTICAFCWQNVAPIERQQQWAIGLTLGFFLPTATLGLAALCVLVIEIPLFLWAFKLGLNNRKHWPHFLGMTNDWERNGRDKRSQSEELDG